MRFFDRLHPVCAFVYFVCVILIAMFTMHPVVVSMCFLTGISLYGVLCGGRRLLRSLGLSLPLMLMVALANPLFSHRGSTVLLFLNDSPITLEAVIYGCFSALMLAGVLYWFGCYSEIVTSDKFIYLFGRIIPRLSLLLSMTLAAVPRLKRQYREIEQAQRAQGTVAAEDNVGRLRVCLRVMSALVSRALEGSIDTGDSMRARGYGLKGRTAYSLFRFTRSDALMLALTLLLAGMAIVLMTNGAADFSYYPVLGTVAHASGPLALYISLAALTGMSILIEIKETISWHILRSNI